MDGSSRRNSNNIPSSSPSSISHDLYPFPFPNLEENVGYDPIHHHHHHCWSSSLAEPERDSEAGDASMRHDACSSPPPPTASSSSPVAASPGGKRGRDPEEEVYLDNLHSHKRYLSEMMASSLNGLTVGDSLGENLMESPSRSDATCNLRDENTSQYSPMSEDSDDARFCDTLSNTLVVQSDFISNTTSPLSPHRYQKPVNGVSSFNPYPLPGCTLAAVVCSHARSRGSDSEGRFPSSPNDVCHTADLRRAALLRSVQMRTQPYCPLSYEAPFHSVPDTDNMRNDEEEEDQTCSFIKSLDDETAYQSPDHISDYEEVCSSVENLGKGKLGQG